MSILELKANANSSENMYQTAHNGLHMNVSIQQGYKFWAFFLAVCLIGSHQKMANKLLYFLAKSLLLICPEVCSVNETVRDRI